MNVQLITIDDIQKYKEIAQASNLTSKIRTAINEAQEFDLRPVLGDELYLDIITKEPDGFGIYEDLIKGSNYSYSGRSFQHDGIKAVLVYYAYARIIPLLDENVTAYGVVQKTNEFSTPSPEKRIAAKVAQAISGAQVMQARVIDYLNRNSTTFPLWRGNITEKKTGAIRVTAIGGKNKVGSSSRCRNCGRYSCRGNCY